MALISKYFNIEGRLPFVDVDVHRDNRQFVDPHRVRLSRTPSPFAARAVECLDTFHDVILDAALSRDPRTRARGRQVLTSFSEPWETRMGLSRQGFHGHGGAEGVGEWIWTELTTNRPALVEVGVLRRLEHLPLFVEGIDRDITSDITTRVILEPLAQFTASMLTTYPQLHQDGVVTVERQVWDPAARGWSTTDVTLPTVGGEPLLLVPAAWAGPHILMYAGRFYDTTVLSHAQSEQVTILPDGTRLKPPAKPQLRKQPGLKWGRDTSTTVTLRAHEQGIDLLRVFERFVDTRYDDAA